jgi:hypothetical protein
MLPKPEKNRTDAIRRAAAGDGMTMKEVSEAVKIATPMLYKILDETRFGGRVRKRLEEMFPKVIARWPWERGSARPGYGLRDVGAENGQTVCCSLRPEIACPHRHAVDARKKP